MTLNYNVTGVARKELVYTIQELIGDRAKYAGMPTQAFIIGPYTVSKTGELTWENGMDAEPLIEALCEKGFEAFTELPEDAEPQETDLLTVSLPGNLFTEMNIANLRKLVDSKATLIKKALGVDELPIFVSEDKISFPWLTGERSPEEAHAFAHLVSALGEAARNAKRITAKEKNTENEKYAFRCFLLRLGFIGDESKADRKVLLKRLSGNSAFSTGHKPVDAATGADAEIALTEAVIPAQKGGEQNG